ncbi:hypothetical protein G7092_08640 [Mucilaginibacter sp. HC2]|uniref:DUF6438 domain-containing protein n=1 Tax=Mucilaginibacter inviolabilis TaxID=2714892 RepID=UPI00140C6927|nr:DUF6438 domain-containing protein [Mucilaginibacter inviolabilis]NHA03860.1 hypothetical protein [Mucilaginibacter inviolabilis]
MRYLSTLFLLACVCICACNDKQQANKKNILGNWVKVRSKIAPTGKNVVLEPPEDEKPGFTFYADHSVEYKLGFFKRTNGIRIFLGTKSKFKIIANDLMILDIDSNKWNKYRLIKLTTDSLQFIFDGRLATFKHYQIKENTTPEFDQIILSTSGCFGTCPVSNTMINADGSVIFNGLFYTAKKGLFAGSITKAQYKQLQDNFRNTDFNLLKNDYNVGWTDDETISTTFVKNGKIYKSVNDYGLAAPYQFTWAYAPLRYLYQSIALKSMLVPEATPSINYPNGVYLKTANMGMALTQSETFLLFYYLQKGKVSNATFKSRYKLSSPFDIKKPHDIDTDGRFYKFEVNKKSIIIDIGFNFLDINEKNWHWQKITE